MKSKFSLINIIILIFLMGSISLNIYFLHNISRPIISNKIKKNDSISSKLISMMVETGAGKYEEKSDDSWEMDKYTFNATLSGCENGSIISYDEENKKIEVKAKGSDRCYAYFSQLKLNTYLQSLYSQDGTNNLYYHDKIGNYTNSNLEAGDFSYRYSGSSESVKNYVCLDGVTETGKCQNENDLYRIIGLFKNDQSEYETKLIKYDYATTTELGDNTTAHGGSYKENYPFDYSNYKGNNISKLAAYFWNNSTNTNIWSESNLNKINLNTFYYKYLIDKIPSLKIVNHLWRVGPGSYTDIETGNAQKAYDNEIGDQRVKVGDMFCYKNYDTTAAVACTASDLEDNQYIGLIYTSDYFYAANPQYWNLPGWENNNNAYNKAANDNWAYMGMYEWTILPARSNTNQVYVISGSGTIWSYNESLAIVHSNSLAIRPCFYLSDSTKVIKGNGTKENPYRLSF